jgi:hypothetical protein
VARRKEALEVEGGSPGADKAVGDEGGFLEGV